MSESLSSEELNHLLALVEEVHKAKTQKQFRQKLIHGVGPLIQSVSCVWTEFGTELFEDKKAQTKVAEISDESIDTEKLLSLFNTYAYQHPVIAHVIETGDKKSNAISDKLKRSDFNSLELYQHFYRIQGVEDQLSIGFVEQEQVKGLSIHRDYWGFSQKEHILANRIADCTFSYYQALPAEAEDVVKETPVIQINMIDFAQFYKLLQITQRQAEILNLVARGQSNKQIAAVLKLSEGTVRKHLENCFRRLGVNNRVSAMTESMKLIEENSQAVL